MATMEPQLASGSVTDRKDFKMIRRADQRETAHGGGATAAGFVGTQGARRGRQCPDRRFLEGRLVERELKGHFGNWSAKMMAGAPQKR
jgi:hypothetical protein